MDVYHIGNTRFADQLSGEGARLHGGRWSHVGTACLYTSESTALCVLEYAANVSLELMPPSLSVTVYALPDNCWKEFSVNELPESWQEVPAPTATKDWGTQQLMAARHLALKLPSVIIPTEFNYLLNPLHPDFKKIRIKAIHSFNFDSRIKT